MTYRAETLPAALTKSRSLSTRPITGAPEATAAGTLLPTQTGHIRLFFWLGYSTFSRRLSPSLTSWMKSSTVWSKLTPWNTTGLKFLCWKDLTNRTVTTASPAISRRTPGTEPVDARWMKHDFCVNIEFFAAWEAEMDHPSLDQSITEAFSSSCTSDGRDIDC